MKTRFTLLLLVAFCTLSADRPLSGDSRCGVSQSLVVADSTGTTILAGFLGALLGELLGKHILKGAAERELAAEQELRREQLTERDEGGLKQIATALEEYSVDHSGAYPARLEDLGEPYLHAAARIIPGSDPEASYTYEHPPSNPNFGAYVIRDNGQFDPTLDHLRNAVDHTLCTRTNCKYIIYTQNGGLYGI